jgi:hypothetical protein
MVEAVTEEGIFLVGVDRLPHIDVVGLLLLLPHELV